MIGNFINSFFEWTFLKNFDTIIMVIKMIEQLLLELGYKNKQIQIILKNESCKEYTSFALEKKIKEIFKFFIDLEYSAEEIIKMTVKHPLIYTYSIDNINKKILFLNDLGYKIPDIRKMTVLFSNLYSLSNLNINDKIQDLVDLGYTKNQVMRIAKKFPLVFGLDINTIKQKFKDLEEMGYTYD